MSLRRGRGARRDDEWCLVNPSSPGTRADVIFHHDRPVAPAPGPGSQERDRSQGPAGRALEACPRSYPWPSRGLAGARSLTAIWEHTTDLTGADLRSLGLEEGQALPSESTIRRVLQAWTP